MLIECILKRPEGTKVQLDATLYHFKPTPVDPRHLAEVLNSAHAKRFLAISEGYVYAGEGKAPEADKPVQKQLHGMPRTSITHPASMEIGERTITLPELTIAALRESGLSVDEWNAQDDEDLYEQLDTTLQEMRDSAAEQEEVMELREAPERGIIPQPEPEPGLDDDDDDEPERKSLGDHLPTEVDDEQEQARLAAADAAAAAAAAANSKENGDDKNSDSDGQAASIPPREELERLYKEKTGRNPSSKIRDERIWQLLNEAD